MGAGVALEAGAGFGGAAGWGGGQQHEGSGASGEQFLQLAQERAVRGEGEIDRGYKRAVAADLLDSRRGVRSDGSVVKRREAERTTDGAAQLAAVERVNHQVFRLDGNRVAFARFAGADGD